MKTIELIQPNIRIFIRSDIRGDTPVLQQAWAVKTIAEDRSLVEQRIEWRDVPTVKDTD